MIRLTALIAAIIGVTALLSGVSASAEPVHGDATCDGAVDAADAIAVLGVLAATDQAANCLPAGDVNCDGHLTIADVSGILRFSGKLADLPAANCAPAGSPHVTPSPSPTHGASPPPAPTFTPGTTPSATPTQTGGPTHSASPTPTLPGEPTSTPTPAPTATPTPLPTNTPSPNQPPRTGDEPECQVLPEDNPWNTDISAYPLHPDSDDIVDRIGRYDDLHPDFGTVWDGKPIGIPYVIVGGGQPKVPVSFHWDDESDAGPYPIPANAPVEGQPVGQPNTASFGGDRHVIVVDESTCTLYETLGSHPVNAGASWEAGSGAIFDLVSNALRPDTWTSADAAGLPIFPGLVRYSEVVEEGEIDHALRFTVAQTRRAFIHPATHYASDYTDEDLPPMGMRFRMKQSYDCAWASEEIEVVCAALKKYGMFVADNGSDWYVSGAPDPRWDDDRIGDLKDIPGDAFEVIYTGEPIK